MAMAGKVGAMATKREIMVANHLREMFIMAWPTRRDLPTTQQWMEKFDGHTRVLLDFVSEVGKETQEEESVSDTIEMVVRIAQLEREMREECEFLRDLSEWDMLFERADGSRPEGMGYVADGPHWKRQIARRLGALEATLAPKREQG